jgi:hypothetical protein
MMRIFVEGISVLGPGLVGWEASRAVLAGDECYCSQPIVIPSCEGLPSAERRRVGVPVRLALAVGHAAFAHAGREAALTATVFASSGGDGDTVHAICEALASTQREVSPTRFHNSVHNAAAGYWGIATGAREPSTSLSCYDSSFAAGLLEAAAQVSATGQSVGLIAYDHAYPEPLNKARPMDADFAAALVLTAGPSARSLMGMDIEYVAYAGQTTSMTDSALESLRTAVPAARCLPLLGALARSHDATLQLAYGDDAQLIVSLFSVTAR